MAERKTVYQISESKKGGKSFWTRIGVAFVNKDGSLNVLLNCFPIDGKLHIRDERKRDSQDYDPADQGMYEMPPEGEPFGG